MSNKLSMEGHFEGLWKRLEFSATLELFPALNICSFGVGLETSAGVRSMDVYRPHIGGY